MTGRSRMVMILVGAAAGAVALFSRRPRLLQNKPMPSDFVNPVAPPTVSPGGVGHWSPVATGADGAYHLEPGAIYRGSFEVMGVASWFDSESAVRGKAVGLGAPLSRATDLGGDRYAVETVPLPGPVILTPHPAVKVERIERWQTN